MKMLKIDLENKTFAIFDLQCSNQVKLRHYEKATKFEKISPTCFDKTAVFTQQHQNKWEIFSNFCDLLRKTELQLK